MTDKLITSSQSVGELLATLKSHGVSRATFSPDGALLQVDFAPAASEFPDVDEPTEKLIQSAVDQGLAALANRGQRRVTSGTGEES